MSLSEVIFGKKATVLTPEEMELDTQRKVTELVCKTRVLKAQTEYDEARIKRAKVLAGNPKLASGGLVGILSKKATWFAIAGVAIIVLIIKAVT